MKKDFKVTFTTGLVSEVKSEKLSKDTCVPTWSSKYGIIPDTINKDIIQKDQHKGTQSIQIKAEPKHIGKLVYWWASLPYRQTAPGFQYEKQAYEGRPKKEGKWKSDLKHYRCYKNSGYSIIRKDEHFEIFPDCPQPYMVSKNKIERPHIHFVVSRNTISDLILSHNDKIKNKEIIHNIWEPTMFTFPFICRINLEIVSDIVQKKLGIVVAGFYLKHPIDNIISIPYKEANKMNDNVLTNTIKARLPSNLVHKIDRNTLKITEVPIIIFNGMNKPGKLLIKRLQKAGFDNLFIFYL